MNACKHRLQVNGLIKQITRNQELIDLAKKHEDRLAAVVSINQRNYIWIKMKDIYINVQCQMKI